VTLQPQELARRFPTTAADDLRHRDLAVVVTDPPGNATEIGKGAIVPFLKRLRALLGEHLTEDRIRVRQRHHKQRHLRRLAPQKHRRFAEVRLGLPRAMAQRNKDLRLTLLPGTHCLLDDRDATLVALLLDQTVEDPLTRVTLLLWRPTVLVEHLMDHRQKCFQLRLAPRLLALIPRRFLVRQNLCQRAPSQAVLLARLPLADLLMQHPSANLNPLVHVLEHLLSPVNL
jgi:hypothetical protein